jgi:hypothetical protein
MKPFFVIAALLLTSHFANAQFLKIGAKGGANLTKLSGKSFQDEFGLGYWAGAFVEVKVGKNWYLAPEVQFSENTQRTSSGFKSIYQNLSSFDTLKRVKLQYLSIPVLLSYRIANILSLQGGAQFGILMDKNQKLLQNGKDAFSNGNVSLLGGVSVNIRSIRVSARYGIGLKNINDIDNRDKWTTQTIQAGVGFVL